MNSFFPIVFNRSRTNKDINKVISGRLKTMLVKLADTNNLLQFLQLFVKFLNTYVPNILT